MGPRGNTPRLAPQVFPEQRVGAGLHLDRAPPLPWASVAVPGKTGAPFATPSLTAAPTYAAQLPVEVSPAGSLAAPVQPAQPCHHDLLLRSEGASRPPGASCSHEAGCPGIAHSRQRVGRWCLCAPAHARRPRLDAKHAPPLPAAGAQPRPEEPAPGGRPAHPSREATPSLGERTPAGTGGRGTAREDQGAWELAGCPVSGGGEPLGTPRRRESPGGGSGHDAKGGGLGCREQGAGAARNRTKAPPPPGALQASEGQGAAGTVAKGSPFPMWSEAGGRPSRLEKPGLCISLTAAESLATPQPPQPRLEAPPGLRPQVQGGPAPRLRRSRPAPGQPGHPH